MSESEASEDPFFVSMRILKALLQPDQSVTTDKVDASVASEARTPDRTAAEAEESEEPSVDLESPTDHDPIYDLRAKLQSAEATVEKERRLRLAVERERDEILMECQEAKKLFESPLPDDMVYLKREALLIESRQNERAMHLKEMDHLHLQMQQAISQRDSMQARLMASQNTIQELERKLANAREIIQVYVAMSNDVLGDTSAIVPTKRALNDDDSAAFCQHSRQGKLAKVSDNFREDKDDSLGGDKDKL